MMVVQHYREGVAVLGPDAAELKIFSWIGPFVRGRCIDLSRAAAKAIGMGGTARVRVD